MTTVKVRVDNVMAIKDFSAASVRVIGEDFVANFPVIMEDSPKVGEEYIITIQKIPSLGALIE
jgi:hypothetical protein